ncbi:RNA polymerase-binding transcription factor DksA [Arenicella chitinivorans]|uniref:RNA polymerase-binding transcription factor DksA n=1 Tax=Arenicella chitinivorans TaxID=1329800 RepID=A0A918S0N2_9GAMM|nr:RNA polymerase-binding protein DksA [Arenicella chitinivorans]GHA16024.1 RNA polymerase-binding transcription factor DksA [Arenicella chitinivorans]
MTKKKTSAEAAKSDNLIHGIEPYNEKAGEEYMNSQQVEHFRNILLSWKRNLLDEVSRTIHLMQDENINHPDPNDRASQETDMSLELRNRDRERKLLKKIEQTLVRVDNQDYGWCDRCGIEIGIRRLEARPTAELCVDCKTLNEIKERQMI